jgi:uncharacterized membrane protein
MSEQLRDVVLVAATVTMGLNAGLFYAFACSVMLGLRRTDDQTFVLAMQRINAAILNGWFAVSFAGAPTLTALATALHLGGGERGSVLPWIGGALALAIAVLVITFTINVPLNNELDAAGEPGATTDATGARQRFEAKWVRWNVVRAAASAAALTCLVIALAVSA